MTTSRVLISGGGIAGSTLAHWLARRGLQPTVVERAAAPRSSGNPVDVRGAAVRITREMGIHDALRADATDVTGMAFVSSSGRQITRVTVGGRSDGEVELARADLASRLRESVPDDVEVLWGDSIAELQQDPGGVDVAFEQAGPQRFDYVVAADGLHSNVRSLAFGPESDFVTHLGLYVATVALPDLALADRTTVLMHNAPGRCVSLHPRRGEAMAALIFRHQDVPGLHHRDVAAQRRLVETAYAGVGWQAPAILRAMQEGDDLYFDAVSRVDVPGWSRGRVALLGDAASSLSLFGNGSSLAIEGAATLAEAIAATPHHPERALAAYERTHRREVRPHQRANRTAAPLLVPRTRSGIAARNLAARAVA